MNKWGKCLALVLAVMLMFSAGAQADGKTVGRIFVEKISVRGICPKGWVLRSYTRETSISNVLNHLRIFRREGAAKEDPEDLPGSDYTIRILYSDDSIRRYRLKAGQYLQMDHGIWYRVDEDRAKELEELLWQMKTDRGVDLPDMA